MIGEFETARLEEFFFLLLVVVRTVSENKVFEVFFCSRPKKMKPITVVLVWRKSLITPDS